MLGQDIAPCEKCTFLTQHVSRGCDPEIRNKNPEGSPHARDSHGRHRAPSGRRIKSTTSGIHGFRWRRENQTRARGDAIKTFVSHVYNVGPTSSTLVGHCKQLLLFAIASKGHFQRKTAVTAYLRSKKLLLFTFARRQI